MGRIDPIAAVIGGVSAVAAIMFGVPVIAAFGIGLVTTGVATAGQVLAARRAEPLPAWEAIPEPPNHCTNRSSVGSTRPRRPCPPSGEGCARSRAVRFNNVSGASP